MGKQYRFYVSSINHERIIDYSKEKGYGFIDSHNNALVNFSYNKNIRSVYLCKKELGDVIVFDKSQLINTDLSPVIQLNFTRINSDIKYIEHGRLWFSNVLMASEFKDLKKYIGSLTNKYNVNDKGYTYSCNMDEETYLLTKQGYGFN